MIPFRRATALMTSYNGPAPRLPHVSSQSATARCVPSWRLASVVRPVSKSQVDSVLVRPTWSYVRVPKRTSPRTLILFIKRERE